MRWLLLWLAALAVAPMTSSCSEERLPPPQGRTAGSAATGGGAPALDAGDAGVDEGPGPGNLCECVAASGVKDSRCGDCINDHAAPGARCEAQRLACDDEPGCRQISLCLKACEQDTACQRSCVFPDDAGAAQRAFAEVLACVCSACGATCAYGAPLECAERDAGTPVGAGGGGAAAGGGAGGADPDG